MSSEAQHYEAEMGPEMRAELRKRVTRVEGEDRLFMLVEVPVQTPFTLDVLFDRLEELTAGLDRFAYVVDLSGVRRPDAEIVREVIGMVRDRIGPVAFFKSALVVPRLPKTRSGKILRGTMQKIADGQPWKMPATIDDPGALEEVTGSLKSAGFANT